jgi:HK97 family phage major capsid protein
MSDQTADVPIEGRLQVIDKITAEFAGAVKQFRDENARMISEIKDGLKTEVERRERMERLLDQIALARAAAPKMVSMPGFDLDRLNNASKLSDGGRDEFNTMLRCRPVGPKIQCEIVEELQRASDQYYMVCNILNLQRPQDQQLSRHEIEGLKSYKRFVAARETFRNTLDTATTGEGLQWIPTGMSADVISKMALEFTVAGLFPTFAMPTDPYDWPFETSLPRARLVPQTTGLITNPYSDLGTQANLAYAAGVPTGKSTLATRKLRSLMPFTRELDEDAVVAILPWLTGRIAYALGDGWERAAQNGDLSATHMDNDTQTDPDQAILAERASAGVRAFVLSATGLGQTNGTINGSGGAITRLMIVSARVQMQEFGRSTSQLALICSMVGYGQLLTNIAEVITPDKYGTIGAAIQSGEVARIDNIPILVGPNWKDNVAATGVNTSAGPNTFTSMALVNRANYLWGTRPGFGVEQERLKVVDVSFLVMFDRRTLKYLGNNVATTGDRAVQIIRNLRNTV